MKLSKETIAILRNFSQHSENTYFTPTNTICVRNNDVLAYAKIKETFPMEFGVYDISEFMGVLGLFEDPELEFTSTFAKIVSGDYAIKYFNTPKTSLVIPNLDENYQPNIMSKFPETEISVDISATNLAIIQKTASVLKSPDISIIGDGSKIVAIAKDKSNTTSNSFEMPLGETDMVFVANLKNSGLKFLPGSYTINISSKKVSKWVNNDQEVIYFVGLENDSSFE